MTDESTFEGRLAVALREYADQAVLPFDPDAIADRATLPAHKPSPWIRLALVATFGLVAVAAFAVAAGQFGYRPFEIGGPPTIGADDLPAIIANASNTPGTWDQTLDQSGESTLAVPMRSTTVVQLDGVVDGHTTEMCGTDAPGGPTNCILAWVGLFETVEQAEAAYDFYVAEFESVDGWNIPPGSGSEPTNLGDEAILYESVQDPAENGPMLTGLYFWRHDNLLLATVGVADMEIDALRKIAEAMDARLE